jgi:hypothetical protein
LNALLQFLILKQEISQARDYDKIVTDKKLHRIITLWRLLFIELSHLDWLLLYWN